MTSFFPPQGGSSLPPDSFVTAPLSFYASPDGSDASGDGSQFNPFYTVSKAADTANSEGGGTVYYAPGTRASALQGGGVWLRGPNDTGAGGAGWTTANVNLSFQPWVSAQTGQFSFGGSSWLPGGTASNFIDGPLQLAGVQGITISNANILANGVNPAMRLGLSSPLAAWSALTTYAAGNYVVHGGIAYSSQGNGNLNHTPTTTPPYTFWQPYRIAIADGRAPTLTSLVRFEGCYFDQLGTGVGPCIDIGGGFWYFFDQCSVVKTGAADMLNEAAVRVYNDGGANTYLTTFNNSRLSGMGWYMAGGGIVVDMYNVTAENMQYMEAWRAETVVGTGSPYGTLNKVTITDSGITNCGKNNGPNQCHAIDCDAVAGNWYVDRSSIATDGVIGIGQTGRTGPAIEAFHDGARRLHAPGTCPYPNIAAALQWFTPTYVKGPDGAASGTHTAAILADDLLIYNESNGWDLPAVGDYYAWGVWIKWNDINPNDQGFYIENSGTGTVGIIQMTPTAQQIGAITLGASGFTTWLPVMPGAVGRWTWYGGAIKITALTGSHNLRIQVSPSTAGVVSHAQPWLIHIPAADALDPAEVGSLMLHGFASPNNGENTTAFTAAPPAPTVGMPAMQPGAKLAFWDDTLHAWKYITVDNGALVIS